MMWSPLVLCLLVGLVTADQNGWKPGQEYTYQVRGRTLAALHQVADQYTGIALKAQLKCQPKGSDALSCHIQKPQVAEIHAQLPGGWDSPLPEKKINYQQFELSEKPFEIQFKNGAIDDLVVEKSLPTWQVNMIKSIVSQLQVDTQGENEIKSRYNQEPEGDKAYATYKTMEDSVTGECEVLYDISPLPEYVLQTKPELAPIPELKGDGQIIDIVKTSNFSNCEQRMAYHFGIDGSSEWGIGSNANGDFLSKSSVSRVVISGALERYTIQSSVTTNKIVVSPTLHDGQKGMVVSRLNITLESVDSASGSPKSPSDPEATGNLVYSYNNPFEANNNRRASSGHKNSGDSSSSSSSSSSSEEDQRHQYQGQRGQNQQENQHGRRHARAANQDSDSSSSSSSSSSESDSLSSSEEYWQPKPTLNEAPASPMLPLFIGYGGSATQQSDKVNPVSIAKKLANQIGAELQKPSTIPDQDTLEKFSYLAALLRTMSVKQIEQVSQDVYAPSSQCPGDKDSQKQSIQCASWSAFRDAVAQAGTGPALMIIKDWILSRKVKGYEAAELIGALPSTSRYPTAEYMDAFFELATSQEVTKQAHLNATAILAFADLARQSQVNNATAHNRYPVHSFGRLSPKNNPAVQNQWIPYIAKQLKNAIRQGDSPKIQTYIRALGNMGHPRMLAVYEPYLEGEEDSSTFQRMMMVLSMDKLAKLYPRHARSVLYKIYQNTGDAYQVRTAAVFQLMRTSPPASMLQRMAEFTNEDTSQQVNSAVKSAIESAANLYDPELSQNARAARDLLTSDDMGLQYSRSWLHDYSIEELNAAYKLSANWIGSEDSIAPQAIFGGFRRNNGGFEMPSFDYAATVSSVDDLLDVLYDQYENDDEESSGKQSNKGGNNQQGSKFSPENILRALNIQTDDREQLEGNVLINGFQYNRFMAFDNNTIEQLPQLVKQAAAALKHGQKFNYTKLYSGNELTVSFPTAMGFPFVYTMRTPSLVQVGGEAQARAYPESYRGSNDEISIPSAVNVSADIQAVYSTKMISRIGFVNPASHQHHMAGFDKNFQVHLPLSTEIDLDFENSHVRVKLEPIDQDKTYNLFHYSSWPYTAQFDLLSEKVVSGQKGYKPIESDNEYSEDEEYSFGQQSTGFAFRFTAENDEQAQPRNWVSHMLESEDPLSAAAYLFENDGIQHSNYNLYLDAKQSQNEAVVLTASYSNSTKGMAGDAGDSRPGYQHPAARKQSSQNSNDDDDNEEEHPTAPEPRDREPDSESRQEQFLRKASSGIKDAYAQSLDFGAEFFGKNKAQYAATIAVASSNVDEKARAVFYYGSNPAQANNYEVCFTAQSSSPRVPVIDFLKALKADPTSEFEADIKFGEQCQSGAQVQIQGKLEQSEERKQYLRHSSTAQQCVEQMEQGDKALPACLNVTARANLLDGGSIIVKYSQIPEGFKEISAQAYGLVKHLAYHNAYVTMDPKGEKDGQIEFEYEVSPDFERLNVTMTGRNFDFNITNLELNEWATALIAVDPVQTAARRIGRKALSGQYNPTCVIDSNHANTFDNRTYPVDLGNCWHVVMTTIPDDDDDDDDSNSNSNNNEEADIPDDMEVSAVCRDVNENERECKLVLGEHEIHMYPNNNHPSIKVNGKPVELSQDKTYRQTEDSDDVDDDEDDIAFEAYLEPTGAVMIRSEEYGVKAVYDGERIKLILNQKYRDQIRGLCGTYSGEPSTDFTAPDNCILKNAEHFAASYALTKQDQCEGPAKENARKAKQAKCYRQTVLFGNVVSDQEAGRGKNQNSNWANNDSRKSSNKKSAQDSKSHSSCTTYRTSITEEDGQICFSQRPVASCAAGCKPTRKQEKTTKMHCVENSSYAQSLVKRIEKGAHPDFSQKAHSKNVRISVPESCVPK